MTIVNAPEPGRYNVKANGIALIARTRLTMRCPAPRRA